MWIFILTLWVMVIAGTGRSMYLVAVEICDNGMDDDQDGLIDLNDPDCECEEVAVISRIPNPSFEETECCPVDRSQLNCATGWIQASEPTTDFIHDCGSWHGWPEFPPPRPYPDGRGIMGFRDGRRIGGNNQEFQWKEYAGACLTEPLLKGETYRFEFYVGFVSVEVSPDIDITFFGTTSCNFLPFGVGNQDLGCPSNGSNWMKLSSTLVKGIKGWVKANLVITPPVDIYAIAIGPPCAMTSAAVSTYYFFDDLVLDDIENFELVISEVSHPCSDNFILSVPDKEGYQYQWYKEGIALQGETRPEIQHVTEGNYQLRLIKDGNCRLTKVYHHAIPVLEEFVSKKICDGTFYRFGERLITDSGSYTDTFISVDGCDSIVYLAVQGLTTIRDTFFAKVFPGDTYRYGDYSTRIKGEHIVSLTDNDGCDYFVHIFLDHFEVFIPNIFSPNNDGNNDYFNVVGSTDLAGIKEISIFDRWGGRVFYDNNILPGANNGWDGRINGNEAPPGVYVYAITVVMNNNLEKTVYGSVSLLR